MSDVEPSQADPRDLKIAEQAETIAWLTRENKKLAKENKQLKKRIERLEALLS